MPSPRPRQPRPRRSAVARPRGPLPARVYWTRRLVALTAVAAAVAGVTGLVGVLSPSSDGGGAEQARAASSGTTGGVPQAATDGPSEGPEASAAASAGKPGGSSGKGRGTKQTAPPASPEGPCDDSDVVVTPLVTQAVGGSPIKIGLRLTTVESPACWWSVSPETLTMRITSGDDEIWTSRECPGALPQASVVVRRDRATWVPVTWSARRSDAECSDRTEWALPGWYHVEAAALAGEPRDEKFEVTAPAAAVVTRTAEPETAGDEGSAGG